MKHIYLSIILFSLFLNSYSQAKHDLLMRNIPKQNPVVKSYIISAKPETHRINSITKYSAKKSGLLSYYIFEKVKFTLTVGINGSMISKINASDLITGEFNDIEMREALMTIKYDARVKIYFTKKFRFLMRAQVIGPGKNAYTAGFFCKV